MKDYQDQRDRENFKEEIIQEVFRRLSICFDTTEAKKEIIDLKNMIDKTFK